MTYQVILPDEPTWTTRPHEPGEPARHVAALSELTGAVHVRSNLWRYEPGARGHRHLHGQQEETFLVLGGTLTIHLGEPPERRDVPVGGLVRVAPGTPLEIVNDGSEDLLVYAHGSPPDLSFEVLDSVGDRIERA